MKTDLNGATRKLVELVERARAVGREQGPLVPVEALVTIERDSWIWQIVDREGLDTLSHRLVFESNNGKRREILMTTSIDTAMSAASKASLACVSILLWSAVSLFVRSRCSGKCCAM